MKKLIFFCFALLSITGSLKADVSDPIKAVINDNFVIELPGEVALADSYIADITKLTFKSAADTERFFAMFSENAVTYQINHAEGKMIINLHRSVMPDWSLSDWNTYFLNRAMKMQTVYDSMFK